MAQKIGGKLKFFFENRWNFVNFANIEGEIKTFCANEGKYANMQYLRWMDAPAVVDHNRNLQISKHHSKAMSQLIDEL